MVKLLTIIRFLNKELNVRKIKDVAKNGLQVKGRKEVKRIAFGVDACLELFKKAKAKKCDLIIVHHGLFWKPQKRKKFTKKRVNFLKKNKMNLYAAHLPLDLHPKYGNNMGICRVLELKNIKKFGNYHGIKIGYIGELKKALSQRSFVNLVNRKLNTKSNAWMEGKKKIKKISLVSGRADDMIEQAVGKADCHLTGEITHDKNRFAKEAKLNLVEAGHYKTEVFGVKALAKLLKSKYNIDTIFIDIPTGL
jgi:dinuclear metal center YbgI/SA1388 family protein